MLTHEVTDDGEFDFQKEKENRNKTPAVNWQAGQAVCSYINLSTEQKLKFIRLKRDSKRI